MTSVAVRGGVIVSAQGTTRADLVIEAGRVVAVGQKAPGADRTVDAEGLLILPGGIDTHVHLMDPGETEREDFPSGTAAAAARGVTTIIEHTHSRPIRAVVDLEEKQAYLAGRSHVDFGLAAHTWPDRLDHIPALWRAGVAFFKIFTCTTHGVPGLGSADLLAALRTLADTGASCLIHCEDEAITATAERALKESGRSDNGILTEWRSSEAEIAAVAGVASLVLVTGAHATIAHVSSPLSAQLVDDAFRRGADLVAEACPQYFALRETEVLEHGALRKFTPPARCTSDAQEAQMWDLVRSGVFGHFSSDHAPSTLAQKLDGDIWSAPFGLPGLDTTFPFLIDAAVREKISFPDVVRLYSDSPARRYGLYPRKGHLGVGADADFVLVDPTGEWQVREPELLSKAGWSPYTGMTFRGRAVATYLRGDEIARDGRAHETGRGTFVAGPGLTN